MRNQAIPTTRRKVWFHPWLMLASLVATGAAGVASPAGAAEAATPLAVYDDLTPLARSQLGVLRGGFVTPEGLRLSIIAQVSAMIDGQLVLRSRLVPDQNGTFVPVTPPSAATASLPPGATQIANGETVSGSGNALSDLAGSPPIAGGSGVVVNDQRGFTAVMHQLPSGALANVIINEAASRAVAQHVEIVISVENFTSVLPRLETGAFGSMLGSAAQRGLVSGLR